MIGFAVVFWYWWALAALLLVCEMTLPGVVFLFLSIGAAAAGLVLFVVPGTPLEIQLIVFAIVSAASALALRPFLRKLQFRVGERNLNARGDSLIGTVIVLDAPILAGRGRARIGDGSWTVVGPDMVAGAKVRVVSVNGTELSVAPAP